MTTAADDRTGFRPRDNRGGFWRGVATVAARRPDTEPPGPTSGLVTVPIRLLDGVSSLHRTSPPRVPAQGRAAEAMVDPMVLVEQAQAGDSEAFGKLYNHYVSKIYRFVIFRVGNRQLAEDLTADTFLRALNRISSFTWQGKDPGAWLFTIARNLIADHFKSSRYQREIVAGDMVADDELDRRREGNPEDAAVDRDTNRALLAAIRHLTPVQQDVIELRFLKGFSVAETAQAMDRNESAIKALQYRAVRALSQLLPEGLRP